MVVPETRANLLATRTRQGAGGSLQCCALSQGYMVDREPNFQSCSLFGHDYFTPRGWVDTHGLAHQTTCLGLIE
jgi:hypothetical protein